MESIVNIFETTVRFNNANGVLLFKHHSREIEYGMYFLKDFKNYSEEDKLTFSLNFMKLFTNYDEYDYSITNIDNLRQLPSNLINDLIDVLFYLLYRTRISLNSKIFKSIIIKLDLEENTYFKENLLEYKLRKTR